MGIQKLYGGSDYSSLFANYKVPSIGAVAPVEEGMPSVSEVRTQSEPGIEKTASDDIGPLRQDTEPVRRGNVDVRELSLTFNAGEDFGYIGSESDIENLDMQKAISDMRKDELLKQYQYFVGSAQNLFSGSADSDGQVFLKY